MNRYIKNKLNKMGSNEQNCSDSKYTNNIIGQNGRKKETEFYLERIGTSLIF